MIDARQRRQSKEPFHEFQHRSVFVQLAGDVAAPGPGRDHQRRHAHPQAVSIHLRRRDMIKKAAALVIGKKHSRTLPRRRVHQIIDHALHLVLSPMDIGGRMLAYQRLRDQERNLRQRPRLQVGLVIVLAEIEARIVLPLAEIDQHVEVFQRCSRADAQVVALPGDMVRVQQIDNGGPVQAAAIHGISRVAAGSAGHQREAIGRRCAEHRAEIVAAQRESVGQRIVVRNVSLIVVTDGRLAVRGIKTIHLAVVPFLVDALPGMIGVLREGR